MYCLAILFGGPSFEHEISILSAKSLVLSLKNSHYNIRLIGIDRQAAWYNLKSVQNLSTVTFQERLSPIECLQGCDVVFNLIHGKFGEDGTMQGFLDVLKIPYIGCSRAGAHNSYDKEITHLMLKESGINVVNTCVLRESNISFDQLKRSLKPPFFIKPALGGSSIGHGIVKDQDQLEAALKIAFNFSKKVLVQEYIKAREIECSVVGDRASRVSEIIVKSNFYDFSQKYSADSQAELICPANVRIGVEKNIQEIALKATEILDSQGMSRVDFFVDGDEIFLNEVNAIPGFTQISLFIKMFEASGINVVDLVDILVQDALGVFNLAKSH